VFENVFVSWHYLPMYIFGLAASARSAGVVGIHPVPK
jgi:hypothetical protein